MQAKLFARGIVFSGAAALLLAGCTGPGADSGGGGATDPRTAAALERAITLLQLSARSPDPATRADCIEALQPSSDPRAAEVIEQGLHDPAWVVRFAAAMATGKRKTTGYQSVLKDLAVNDPNDSVKVAAIYALRRLGDTEHMNTLAQTLHSPDPGVRANTALVLGLMGDPSAITLLRAIRTETQAPVKFEIISALARLGDPRSKSVIISMAFSKYAEDQDAAMMVCADLIDGTGPLVMGLRDIPPNVPADEKEVAIRLTTRRQLIAARALGIRNSLEGLKIAENNCRNPDPELRSLAAMALGEMIHGTGVRVLVPLLEDKDPRVQRAAAQAIVNVSSRKEPAK